MSRRRDLILDKEEEGKGSKEVVLDKFGVK